MKSILSYLISTITLVTLTLSQNVLADKLQPTPITADEAFDAVTMQFDPATGYGASVILVDVRDPLEIWSSGAAAEVTTIHFLDGREVAPDDGKVRLVHDGKFIEYDTEGRYKRTKVDKLNHLDTKALANNIIYWRRLYNESETETQWDKTTECAFHNQMAELVDEYDVVILYCRTGGRSSMAGELILNDKGQCIFGKNEIGDIFEDVDALDFLNVYEIDDTMSTNKGGFSGSNYSDVFNGYAGFPERLTDNAQVPSVSWIDSGLPVNRAVIITESSE